MRGRGWVLVCGVVVMVLLAGCVSHGGEPTQPTQPTGPAPRTTWALRHRVAESADLQVTSNTVGHYDESTGVALGPGGAESCFATVSSPGHGGPNNWVGEKVSTRFRGVPALRNGPGAEGSYLMWQLEDRSWVTVSCTDPGDSGPVDVVAAAVELKTSSIRLPFGLAALPDGYGVAQIMQQRSPSTTSVYVGRARPQVGFAGSDLEIVSQPDDPIDPPTGRAVTVGSRPALVSDDPKHPKVCVDVQDRHVCVRITPSDTGPYPDRSAEIPTLLDLAGALTYAADLDDQSTWFAAEEVFG